MKASEIAKHANNLTDENFSYTELMGFINDGLAEINAELNANFPFVTVADEEIPFPETWQRMVLVPFAGAKIKQKDSSQFEYNDLYSQFQVGLLKMKSKYTIPDAYTSSDLSDDFEPDYTGHFNNWG